MADVGPGSVAAKVKQADENPIFCSWCERPIATGQHYITALVGLETSGLEAGNPTVALEGVYDLPSCLSYALLAQMAHETSILSEPFLRR